MASEWLLALAYEYGYVRAAVLRAEAKLKEIEERYRGELRERKACVTFETELGRQLKALISSVQTEQTK